MDVVQAAKYVPYLEIVFGPNYDVIPALVVTRAKNHFLFYEIEGRDGILRPVQEIGYMMFLTNIWTFMNELRGA